MALVSNFQSEYVGAVQFEFSPGLVVWPVGDWLVRWNLVGVTSRVVWTGVRVYRTRGCGVVGLVGIRGSSTEPGPNVGLSQPGVKEYALPASFVSLSVGSVDDRVLVVCSVTSGGSQLPGDSSWSVRPDQLIDTPLGEYSVSVGGVGGGLARSSSVGRLVGP